ncbi:hypothetical protein GCM10011376_26560 [Nocardioides flavus (ex Wang et al. 2016)]|uniref:Probable membrane transporter protein n=1 Tax=Nocardioides flavus (ex Wang et al. 2016) TaxID=2058780 RepID=A0ABQ3HMU4_9ACTN|nr:sulfite exporter TauE/SafE family protein [Nocardioides flavus (ex Wang et al. 2016)]GHE18046.1 hypothetical protein GCM10011376_26560 [Nocardioides flavus (ex Wang et al. 2016)]
MSLDLPTEHLLLLAAVTFLGAMLQGVVGLGLGLLVAPIAGIIEPALLPGVPLCLALVMPLLTLTKDVRHVDWPALAWALPARVPGTVVGVVVVALATPEQIGVIVGLAVLVAVLLTVRTVQIPVTRASLAGAGFVSGVTGTATSIGGPPLALLLQRRPPDQTRGTLGAYFVVGAAFSVIGLWASGHLVLRDVSVALAMLPAMTLGFYAAMFLRSRVPAASLRGTLLLVCAVSALVLVVRSIS